jgi:hypothetical protein
MTSPPLTLAPAGGYMGFLWMFLLSVAASILIELANPVHPRFDFMLAGIAGRAVAIYVVSGIIPLTIWAVQHNGRRTARQ